MGGFDHNPHRQGKSLATRGFQETPANRCRDLRDYGVRSLSLCSGTQQSSRGKVAKVALDFWHPKPLIVAAAKPRTAMEPDAAKDAPKKPVVHNQRPVARTSDLCHRPNAATLPFNTA